LDRSLAASAHFLSQANTDHADIVSIVVIAASNGRDDVRKTIDIAWRWVIGLGAVPGVLALAFRFAIPETPRFLLDIEDDPIKAEFDATPMFGDTEMEEGGSWGSAHGSTASAGSGYDEIILPAPAVPDGERTVYGVPPLITLNSSWKLSRADIIQYFWTEGNWRTLFATSMTWLLLDFGFCKNHHVQNTGMLC
jgi:MFS transporter, PHS family, inorganic phosphate transporter